MSGVDTRPMLALLQRHIGGCREEMDSDKCWAPTEYVLWGKLLPAEAFGPRCYEHARKHVPESGLASRSDWALIRLADLALDIALEVEPETADSTPPHSLEAEMATLGCLLISDKDWAGRQIGSLTRDHFYDERHRVVFEVINSIPSPAVIGTLERRLAPSALDDVDAYLDSLVMSVPNVDNLRRYAQIVREMAHLRAMLLITRDLQASTGERA